MFSKKQLSLFLLCLLLCFFLFPDISFLGARNGILLWIKIVIPSLFPFLLVSTCLLHLNLISCLTPVISPFFCKIFGCSKNGCYPILIGLLSGYPMGAKACADLVKKGDISKEEGQYLLGFVNNASPMFITSYLTCQCLQLPQYRYIFYFMILCSSYLVCLFYRFFFSFKMHRKNSLQFMPANKNQKSSNKDSQVFCNEKISFFSVSKSLDLSITDSFLTIAKIGGYVILFSLLGQFALSLPKQLGIFRYFIICCLEITSGVNQIAISDFPLKVKIILALSTTALGGISGVFQTHSVIASSGLSSKKYFIAKLLQSLFLFMLLLLFTLTI